MSSMQEFVKRLLDERLRAVEAAKAIQFDVEARGGKWTAEDEQAWEKANGDIDELNKRIQSTQDLEERNRETEAQRAKFEKMIRPSEFAAHAESDEEKLRTFVRASLPDSDAWAPKGITFYMSNEDKAIIRANREQRDLSKLTAGAGGNLVPTGFVARLYQHLVEEATVRQVAGILTTDSGENLLVPKTTAHGAAAQTAEAATIAESDPTFGQVTMNAYKYAQLIQISTELAEDSGVDLTGYLAEAGGRNVGLVSGTDYVLGTGVAEPEGVATNMTAGKTGAVGQTTSVTADDLYDLFHSIVTSYRRNGTWMANDASIAKIRKLKDTTNQYLWMPGLQFGVPDTLLGRPVLTDPNVAVMAANAKSIYFGDFSRYYLIRDVNAVTFTRSDDFAFASDLISFKVRIRTDGKPIVTDAVKAYVNSAT